MLKKMGWRVEIVPFFFRIVHPQSFLKQIVFLRQQPHLRSAIEILRWTGLGYVGLKTLTSLSAIPRTLRIITGRTWCSKVEDFGGWADVIWNSASPRYEFISIRTSAALNVLYPSENTQFIRLMMGNAKGPLGWAVVMATQMKGHKQFGDMKVGSLVDALALPGYEKVVIDHAVRTLEEQRVDLIVSNQCSSAWKRAMQLAGLFRGPSNFAIACSKKLAADIRSLESCHFTRGDGDGPVNL
jgi:hypothetical protein